MISARLNKIGDISPFVLSSEQTLYGISAGKVEGLKIESVRRVPSVSETGVSTYESDIGDYFTREISPGFESDTGRNIIAERKIARASEFINKQLGSSFPAKGKPVIGESQAIIQNALNRIAIQGDLSANMGRVKELQYGYQEFAPIKETRQYKGGGFYPQVTLSTPGSRWNDLETLPDYMKSGRGNINAVERGVSESTPVSYGGAKNLVSEAMRMDEIGDLAISAPKPASTSKAKVRIEEEEPEYYREVPGRKRPAPSVAIGSSLAISQMNRMLSSTLQFQPSASSQKQAQEVRQQQESRQKQSQVSWQGSIADQMFGQKTAQEQRQEQRLKSEQVSKQDTSSALDRITGLDTRQALRTTQRTRQDITTDITPEIVPDLTIRIKTDKIIIPGIPDLGGYGPSGGGSNSGFTFTEKLNVVSRRQALIGDRMDTMTGLGKASNSKKFKIF